MIRSIWNSRSGMSSQMEKLDIISNNIANVNTIGYKKLESNFSALMQESFNRLGYPVNSNERGDYPYTGTGVKTSGVQRNFSQGSLTETDKSTDLAIDGKGMFKVIDINGNEAYTRAGSFKIDATGSIVDDNGNRLVILNTNGDNINKPGAGFTEENFIVDENGNLISKEFTGSRIPVYITNGDYDMYSTGENLYKVGQQSQVMEDPDSCVLQGFTENSNVDLTDEITDLIMAQRAYQLNSTALKTADEMWQMANNLKGR